jgi:hypothetical protein
LTHFSTTSTEPSLTFSTPWSDTKFFSGFDARHVKEDTVWWKAPAKVPVQGPRVTARIGASVADEDSRHGKFLQVA